MTKPNYTVLTLLIIFAVVLPISVGLTLTFVSGRDLPPAQRVHVREAPPVAAPSELAKTSSRLKQQLAGADYELAGGATGGRTMFELGKEAAKLANELKEANKALYFIDCIEMKTGVRYSSSKTGSSNERPFPPEVLSSSAAIECRDETNVAASKLDFAEVCEAIAIKWSNP